MTSIVDPGSIEEIVGAPRSTPHLARATEALARSESRATKRTEYGEMSTPILLLAAADAARRAVSAALHDPDDPDALAREYVARLAHESWETGCQRVCFHATWDDMDELERNTIRAQLDAMTTVVLGTRKTENDRG